MVLHGIHPDDGASMGNGRRDLCEGGFMHGRVRISIDEIMYSTSTVAVVVISVDQTKGWPRRVVGGYVIWERDTSFGSREVQLGRRGCTLLRL